MSQTELGVKLYRKMRIQKKLRYTAICCTALLLFGCAGPSANNSNDDPELVQKVVSSELPAGCAAPRLSGVPVPDAKMSKAFRPVIEDFEAFVARNFPVGSDERRLLAWLQQAGFERVVNKSATVFVSNYTVDNDDQFEQQLAKARSERARNKAKGISFPTYYLKMRGSGKFFNSDRQGVFSYTLAYGADRCAMITEIGAISRHFGI